jgi:hypothetical protein
LAQLEKRIVRSLYLSIYLYIYLSICLSVCLSVCLYLSRYRYFPLKKSCKTYMVSMLSLGSSSSTWQMIKWFKVHQGFEIKKYMIMINHRLSIYTSMIHSILSLKPLELALNSLDTLSDNRIKVFTLLF